MCWEQPLILLHKQRPPKLPDGNKRQKIESLPKEYFFFYESESLFGVMAGI